MIIEDPGLSEISEIVLAVQNLTVYRESHCAVEDVSFVLEAGTDTAIIGPNGAGKSSLVQAILGVIPSQRGQVFFLGQPLKKGGPQSRRLRQQVAYLPQNFLCDRRIPMTVEELVGLGWDYLSWQWPWQHHRQRQQAVSESLSRVGGDHLGHKLISDLSGGETKRVLLAYCLVRPRRLLILDEAPAGLDWRGEAEFYQLLDELKQEQGWAILQISHNLDRVRHYCDRVLCLNRQLLCEGLPDIMLTRDNLARAYGLEGVRYHHFH